MFQLLIESLTTCRNRLVFANVILLTCIFILHISKMNSTR